MKYTSLLTLISAIILLSGCTLLPGSSTPPVKPRPAPVTQPVPVAAVSYPTGIQLSYIRIEDAGANGTLIGCNDSRIDTPYTLDGSAMSRTGVLTQVYTHQLSGDAMSSGDQTFVTNALTISNITISGTWAASIALSGSLVLAGICDHPRIQAQLTAPALQFAEITSVLVWINGTLLDDYLSLQ